MNTLKFKTNINCSHCIAKVTPYLNESKKINEWNVDTENPDKILIVSGENITPEYIKETLSKSGYTAEEIR